MSSATHINIPGEKVNWELLAVAGVARGINDKNAEPSQLKCPKCQCCVMWTEFKDEAEVCGCGLKWLVAGGTNGGLYIFGTRGVLQEIELIITRHV